MSTSSSLQKKALLYSLFLHVGVLLLLIYSFEFSEPLPVVSNHDNKIVNAVALTDSPVVTPSPRVVEDKVESLPSPPTPPQPQPPTPAQAAPAPAASQALPTEKKLALLKKPATKLEKKITAQPVKKDLAKKLLADLENEISKQAQTKQKLIKKKFNQALKTQSEQALQELLKTASAGPRAQHTDGVINKYKALILQAISQQWVVPGHVDKRLSCELMIRLTAQGAVLDVQVTKSSGDLALDRSARAAVFKASPLPVPADSDAFEPFRQFVLKVKPENIQENNLAMLG